jgi:hypothetical protein
VEAGTLLRLRASGVMMLRGLAVKEVRAGDVSLDVVHRFSWEEMQRDWMWHIRTMSVAMVRCPEPLAGGTTVVVTCKSRPTPRIADLTWTLRLVKIEELQSVEALAVSDPLKIHFIAGAADHLEAYLKPDGRVFVEQFDCHGNPTKPGSDDESRELTLMADGREAAGTALSAVPATELRSPAEVQPAMRTRVVDGAGREAVSNAAPLALDETPIFFGEFHWHTDFSADGPRTLGAALTSARDELGLDFAGPADHMTPDGLYAERLPIEQAKICSRFDAPERFATIPGAELSARYGHANLYAASFDDFIDIAKRFPEWLLPAWQESPNSYPLDVLSGLCPEGRAIVVPHHTNMTSSMGAGVVRDDGRPFWCAWHWPLATPLLRQAVRLIEIVQNRGAFETEEPDPAWRVAWGRLGGSAQTALMRGHRLGFIGGTDNHTGWPTRLAGEAGYGGLTAVQAPRLETEALFDALYRRRCYATTGVRIVADATLNDQPIGSELRLDPGVPREFRIRIHGTAELAAVQIIQLGTVLADLEVAPHTLDFETHWVDERPGRPLEDVYYYVRARQVDGHCVWLSPWWIDLPE